MVEKETETDWLTALAVALGGVGAGAALVLAISPEARQSLMNLVGLGSKKAENPGPPQPKTFEPVKKPSKPEFKRSFRYHMTPKPEKKRLTGSSGGGRAYTIQQLKEIDKERDERALEAERK